MVSGLQSYLLPIYSSATASIRAVITRLLTQPCWYRSRLIICKFASIFLVLPVTIASASRPQHLNSSPVHSYEISLFLVLGNSLAPLDQPTSTDLPACSAVSPPILTSGHHQPGLFYSPSTSKKCVSVSSWVIRVQS